MDSKTVPTIKMFVMKPVRDGSFFYETAYFLTCSNVFESQFLGGRFLTYVFNKRMNVVSGSRARGADAIFGKKPIVV